MMTDRRLLELYTYASLAIALSLGFSLAIILVTAPALGFSGEWFESWIQVHGHVQLMGWVGIFVIGVGLFFVPRLRGTVLARTDLGLPALVLLVVGIVLRALSQMGLGIGLETMTTMAMSWGYALSLVSRGALVLSGVLEVAGVAVLLYALGVAFGSARPLSRDAPITPVMPYLLTAAASFALALTLNAVLVFDAGVQYSSVLRANWDNVFTHLMIYGFVIPMAFALSIRNLPLFMRLAFPPKEQFLPNLLVFDAGLSARLLGFVIEQPFATYLSGFGMLLEGAAVLYFIWSFDVLFRRKNPWTVSRIKPPPGYVETRRPTRPGYPDYGEYGRFELLVISAYAWLALGGLIAAVNGITLLIQGSTVIYPDVERHSITIGFITLLIFGMAVRMLPGFASKNRVASNLLVLATFWLGNAAALSRLALLVFPDLPGAVIAYESSGLLGWLAVACLAVNLWRTFHIQGRST